MVVPNILIFTVIPKLGSGFTGILFTLSPIFTLAFSSLWEVKKPNQLGLLGIAIGFLGAIIVTLTRGEVNQPAGFIWVIIGLCIPVSLAIGNVYRTVAWPINGKPLELATGSNLMAAFVLLIVVIFVSDVTRILDLFSIKDIALIQVVGSVAMFSIFFRLQQVGGPTYLSQIGYIAAGVALLSGTLFLNESYSIITWVGASIILIGIGFSILAQKKESTNHLQQQET